MPLGTFPSRKRKQRWQAPYTHNSCSVSFLPHACVKNIYRNNFEQTTWYLVLQFSTQAMASSIQKTSFRFHHWPWDAQSPFHEWLYISNCYYLAKVKLSLFHCSLPEMPAVAMPTKLTFLYQNNRTCKYYTWTSKTRMKQLGNAAHLTYVLI